MGSEAGRCKTSTPLEHLPHVTNEVMMVYFYNVNKHEILVLSSKGSLKTKKGQI